MQLGFSFSFSFFFLRVIAAFNALWLPLGSESKLDCFSVLWLLNQFKRDYFQGRMKKKIFQNKKKKSGVGAGPVLTSESETAWTLPLRQSKGLFFVCELLLC